MVFCAKDYMRFGIVFLIPILTLEWSDALDLVVAELHSAVPLLADLWVIFNFLLLECFN